MKTVLTAILAVFICSGCLGRPGVDNHRWTFANIGGTLFDQREVSLFIVGISAEASSMIRSNYCTITGLRACDEQGNVILSSWEKRESKLGAALAVRLLNPKAEHLITVRGVIRGIGLDHSPVFEATWVRNEEDRTQFVWRLKTFNIS